MLFWQQSTRRVFLYCISVSIGCPATATQNRVQSEILNCYIQLRRGMAILSGIDGTGNTTSNIQTAVAHDYGIRKNHMELICFYADVIQKGIMELDGLQFIDDCVRCRKKFCE